MEKKMYSAPVVKSEGVVLGVFGNYNLKPGNAAGQSFGKRHSNGWGWIFRMFRR